MDEETELITDRSAWGPGKVDVTADQQFNPVYISDLRPIRFQKTLHRAASLHNNLLSLASRIETLIITSLNQRYRSPRKLAFALALYLWSLGEALPKVSKLKSRFKEAWSILKTECQSCHQGDDLAGEGVPIESVRTDPAVGQSSASFPNRLKNITLDRVSWDQIAIFILHAKRLSLDSLSINDSFIYSLRSVLMVFL